MRRHLCRASASFLPNIWRRHKYAHHRELSRLLTDQHLLRLHHFKDKPQAHTVPTPHLIASLLNQPVSSQIWQSLLSGRCYLIHQPKVVCHHRRANIVPDICIYTHQKAICLLTHTSSLQLDLCGGTLKNLVPKAFTPQITYYFIFSYRTGCFVVHVFPVFLSHECYYLQYLYYAQWCFPVSYQWCAGSWPWRTGTWRQIEGEILLGWK